MLNTPEEYKDELRAYLEGLSQNVRQLRAEHDPPWSQTDLHNATKLHRTEIGKIENAEIEPRLATLHILAGALGVPLDDLVKDLPVPVMRKPQPQPQRR